MATVPRDGHCTRCRACCFADLPDANGAVSATSDEGLPISGKDRIAKGACRTGHSLDRAPCRQLPQAQDAITATAGQGLPIGRKGHGVGQLAVTFELLHQLATATIQ